METQPFLNVAVSKGLGGPLLVGSLLDQRFLAPSGQREGPGLQKTEALRLGRMVRTDKRATGVCQTGCKGTGGER